MRSQPDPVSDPTVVRSTGPGPSGSGSDDRPAQRPAPVWLKVVTVFETASLALLLLNLVVIHNDGIKVGIGPVHGVLYLITIVAVCALPNPSRARWYSIIPAVGGLVAVRRIDAVARHHAPESGDLTVTT